MQTTLVDVENVTLDYQLDIADPAKPFGVVVTVNRDAFVQLVQGGPGLPSAPGGAHSLRAGVPHRFDVVRLTHKRPNYDWGVWILVFDHVSAPHPVKRSQFVCLEK